MPKYDSGLNILVYFLEQFQRYSRGLQPLEYTLKCSQLISSSDNKKILLTTSNVRLDSGNNATKYYLKKKLNLLCWENAEIHSTAFFSKKTKITLLQGLSSSAFYMLYIFVVSTAWVKYKNKSWKVSLGYLLFHISTGIIFQMPTLFCFSLGDKVQLFWEDHKISQLSSNCFDKSADLLSECKKQMEDNSKVCGLRRKAEL